MRKTILGCSLVALLAAGALLPGAAGGEGLPATPGLDIGASGVTDGSGSRYVTIPAGPNTVVARTDVQSGKVERSVIVRGAVTTPAVAYDGSASGLSADGRTLVLIRPRAGFPRARTSFAILRAPNLRVREWITLRGDFSFDAISPDGSLMYLVRYLSPRDPTRYEVRAYDLHGERLLPQPIVDPEEPDEQMGGHPLTRSTSPDGRWAYTLYRGTAGHEPFIHALDTVGRTAACIDLPQLLRRPAAGPPRLGLRLSPAGDELRVTHRRRGGLPPRSLLAVDTESFAVRTVAAAAPATTGSDDAEGKVVGVIALLCLAAAGIGVAIRRGGSRGPREALEPD